VGWAGVVAVGAGVTGAVADGVEETEALGFVAGARPPVGPLGDQNRIGTTAAAMAAAAAVRVVRRRVRRRLRPMAAAAKSPGASIRVASSCRVWRRSSSLGVMP
jgi:hypothetical protein